MNIQIINTLQDNYSYLVWQDKKALVIDPSEATPIQDALGRLHLQLGWILNTHHHADHCGGNQELKKTFRCEIISGSLRTPGVDRTVADGETLLLDKMEFRIIATPGHTRDSVCVYMPPQPGWLFTGDTLFIAGCGRLFEGAPEVLWASLRKLALLPDSTEIYCGHEYTLGDYDYAQSLDPSNTLIASSRTAAQLRLRQGQPTVPSTLALEKQTNPFLRAAASQELGDRRKRKDLF